MAPLCSGAAPVQRREVHPPWQRHRLPCESPQTLVIQDTGLGIAPEDLPRVFERGYTGKLGRVDQRSTGIGLYLCRRTLSQLGHTISIQSTPWQRHRRPHPPPAPGSPPGVARENARRISPSFSLLSHCIFSPKGIQYRYIMRDSPPEWERGFYMAKKREKFGWEAALREFRWSFVVAALAFVALGLVPLLWPDSQYACAVLSGGAGPSTLIRGL